jgi:hypothetical protein
MTITPMILMGKKIHKTLTERLWGENFDLGPLIRKKLGDSTVNTMLNIHAGVGMEMNLPEPEDIGFVEKLIGEGAGMVAELPIYAGGYAYGLYKTKKSISSIICFWINWRSNKRNVL